MQKQKKLQKDEKQYIFSVIMFVLCRNQISRGVSPIKAVEEVEESFKNWKRNFYRRQNIFQLYDNYPTKIYKEEHKENVFV